MEEADIKGSASSSGQVLPIGPNTPDSCTLQTKRDNEAGRHGTGPDTAHWPAELWAGSGRHQGGEGGDGTGGGGRREARAPGPSAVAPRHADTQTLSTATTTPRSQVPTLRGQSVRFRFDHVN